ESIRKTTYTTEQVAIIHLRNGQDPQSVLAWCGVAAARTGWPRGNSRTSPRALRSRACEAAGKKPAADRIARRGQDGAAQRDGVDGRSGRLSHRSRRGARGKASRRAAGAALEAPAVRTGPAERRGR